jgi:hypothetical protein
VEGLHHLLQGRLIDDIAKIQGADIAFRFEDGLQLFADDGLALPQFAGAFFQKSSLVCLAGLEGFGLAHFVPSKIIFRHKDSTPDKTSWRSRGKCRG